MRPSINRPSQPSPHVIIDTPEILRSRGVCADRMRLAPSLAEQRTKEEREKSRGGRSERNVGWLFFPPSLLSIITFILRCVWLESTAAHTPAPKQLTILLHFQAQEAAAAAAARKQQCPTQVSEETTPPPSPHHAPPVILLNPQHPIHPRLRVRRAGPLRRRRGRGRGRRGRLPAGGRRLQCHGRWPPDDVAARGQGASPSLTG